MKQRKTLPPDSPHSKRHGRRRIRPLRLLLVGVLCAGLCTGTILAGYAAILLGQYVLSSPEKYRVQVELCAQKYGVEEYVPYLMAIMEVESGGRGQDVMQSSESLGLQPNTLDTQSSIEQGVFYFSTLLERAQNLGCDMDAVVQAYNYGPGYLDFVAANGGAGTFELAQEFARTYSNETTIAYYNPIAVAENGGWRYMYGNMFYTALVHQALTVNF